MMFSLGYYLVPDVKNLFQRALNKCYIVIFSIYYVIIFTTYYVIIFTTS